MITVRTAEHGEQLLARRELPCPTCGAALRPFGHARTRTVRGAGSTTITATPRRARCPRCHTTQVLLPAQMLARHSDSVEVVTTALAHHALGRGVRTIAARLGRPATTVRRWLQRVDEHHTNWLYRQVSAAAVRIEPELFHPERPRQHTALATTIDLLIGAAVACRRRFGPTESVWAMVGILTHGRLLPVPLRT